MIDATTTTRATPAKTSPCGVVITKEASESKRSTAMEYTD
jgi:hypothetical protein